ncbi:MAG TPA: PCP reductase family protein [bacterium]|nr:PCP reductase family protein [bacterium]
MKFLCVRCDEAMKFTGSRGPDEGSLSVMFQCPHCNYEIAMLTNPGETQMVTSLGVQVGGRSRPAEPYEQVRGSLANQRDGAFDGTRTEVPSAEAEAGSQMSGCPFAGMLSQQEAPQEKGDVAWTPEAASRVERIPGFVRSWAKKAIEGYAKEHGYAVVDERVMDEAREKIGM